MNKRTIRLIVIAASLLLIALVAIQVLWVRESINIQRIKFRSDVTNSLLSVVQIIQENANDSVPIYDPVERKEDDYYIVRIHDTLHPFYLEALLNSEFKQNEIDLEFEYSIYDCFTDSVVYSKAVISEGEVNTSFPSEIKWNNDDGHYFSVFFPNLSNAIYSRYGFWLVSSAVLLIIVAFFVYIITVILRQRRLSQIKTDFINNMTHEFKTPISTILLSSEVLSDQSITEKPERLSNYAQIIQNESHRLQNQVERILQIATIEKERVELKSKELSMHSIIARSIDTFKLNIEAQGGVIRSELQAENDRVKGDEVHMLNVISNLLDNAIKYSPQQPEIGVKTYNEKDTICIEISDKGMGISPAELKQIFEKFYRVNTGNVHDIKGFGIGLHYVDVMIRQHNGRIRVLSKESEGSTFILSLPTY